MGGMSNKKKLTMAMGVYNSQFIQYMTAVGYMKDATGTWVKVEEPELSEEMKVLLRKKKDLLTQTYPLLKMYDQMVSGVLPYSAVTEQELLALVDQLAAMTGGVK
jgi:hypothetical protein